MIAIFEKEKVVSICKLFLKGVIMGNRAVIAIEGSKQTQTAIYLHWNGGIESVATFLKYCEVLGFRPPDSDSYGWTYLSAVIANFFGNGMSVGIGQLRHQDTDNGDNGVYYIKGWEIVGRSYKRTMKYTVTDDDLEKLNSVQCKAFQDRFKDYKEGKELKSY